MVERLAKDALIRLAAQFPVVGITGPRQSGKTTLAKLAFPQKKYISFDDKGMREMARTSCKDFLLAFPDGAIIDEAQKVPEIFDAVKFHVDNNTSESGTFILTGSSQFKLKENMTDSLAGRVGFLRLLPFSMEELQSRNLLGENPYQAMLKGGYPPLHDDERHFIPEDWFENYVDSYLDLDVKEHINPSNVSTFKRFVQVCAVYSGQLLSMDSIARNLGISAPTVKLWLSILESSFIIHLLEPDFNNLGKSIVKTPKLYFVDTGLLCHLLRIASPEELILSPHKGKVVETYAISELMKHRTNLGRKPNLTFFRDAKGFEVDTIADWKRTFAIEIKSSSESGKKFSENTKRYLELRQDRNCRGVIFYLGDLTCTINGIQYVAWQDWGNLAKWCSPM